MNAREVVSLNVVCAIHFHSRWEYEGSMSGDIGSMGTRRSNDCQELQGMLYTKCLEWNRGQQENIDIPNQTDPHGEMITD